MQLKAAFGSLTQSFTAQRAQLDAYAHEQQVCTVCKWYCLPLHVESALNYGYSPAVGRL